jgi:hypothetical protein
MGFSRTGLRRQDDKAFRRQSVCSLQTSLIAVSFAMDIVYIAHDRDPNAEAEYDYISTLEDVRFERTTSDKDLADALCLDSDVTILTGHGWRPGEASSSVWALSSGDSESSIRPKDIIGAAGTFGARYLLVTACDASWTRADPGAKSAAEAEWQETDLGSTSAFIVQGRLTYRASRVFVTHLLNDLINHVPLNGNADFAQRIAAAREKTQYSLRLHHGSVRVTEVKKDRKAALR